MIDVVLFAGRLLLLALLYLFLFAAVKTGIGMVSESRKKGPGLFELAVVAGPPELRGVVLPLKTAVVIGRSPGADIVVADDFISGRHARVIPQAGEIVLEDLGSTNGTLLNGSRISRPQSLRPGDLIEVGALRLKVDRR